VIPLCHTKLYLLTVPVFVDIVWGILLYTRVAAGSFDLGK